MLHRLENVPEFALMSVSGSRLLLPREDVHAIEGVQEIEGTDNDADSTRWISVEGNRWPVYCLNADLRVGNDIPPEHRLCALVGDGERRIGIVCAELTTHGRSQFQLMPVPDCMRTPGTLLRALAVQGEEVLCVTTGADLAASVEEHAHG